MNIPKVYSTAFQMASGITISSALNLQATYRKMFLEIPTMASGGTMYLQGSRDGTTFRQIYQDNTASGAAAIFQIAQTASNCMLPIPCGFQYYKLENTTGNTQQTTVFNLICFD